MNITKLIIPAAGYGTRFLPVTKSVPKELLPLLNKPAIHYIIEEGSNTNIRDFILITSRNKNSLVDYFDVAPDLEHHLKEKNKLDSIKSIEIFLRTCQFTYIRQSEPLGLGHAIWTARNIIGKEYVGICLPDDIIISKQPALDQLIRVARQEKASVIAVQEVPPHVVSSYGIIAIKKQITPNLFQVADVIEKPALKDAPSNLAIIGRYVLSPKIFQALEDITQYATDELQLTDGISQMIKNNEKVFAVKIQGTRYDIGTPIGWIKAIISLAAQHPEYSADIREFLADINTLDSFLYNQQKNIDHNLP
jgi:UTP--glucose-1-phosphate uridylyltransferase